MTVLEFVLNNKDYFEDLSARKKKNKIKRINRGG